MYVFLDKKRGECIEIGDTYEVHSALCGAVSGTLECIF